MGCDADANMDDDDSISWYQEPMVIVEVMRAKASETGFAGVSGNGSIQRLTVHGHAGYARSGEDIVCAAASAIIYTTAGALEILCGVNDSCEVEKDGFFEITLPANEDISTVHRADIIMETAYIGFKQIESSYPGFLKVSE